MRPSLVTRKPLPWAIGLPSLSDMTMDTMAPLAALAIAGMSFRGGADCACVGLIGSAIRPGGTPLTDPSGGADCAATTPAKRTIRERSFIAKRPLIPVSLTCKCQVQSRRSIRHEEFPLHASITHDRKFKRWYFPYELMAVRCRPVIPVIELANAKVP